MKNKNIVVDIGFNSNIDSFIKEVEKKVGSLDNILDNIGENIDISSEFKKEIEAMRHELSGFKTDITKTFAEISGTKVNSKTFEKFKRSMENNTSQLEDRVKKLELQFILLQDQLSKIDAGNLTSELNSTHKEFQAFIDDIFNSNQNLRELISLMSEKKIEVNFADNKNVKELRAEFEMLSALFNKLTSSMDSKKINVDIYKNWSTDDYKAKIQEVISSIDALENKRAELEDVSPDSPEIESIQKQTRLLESELIEISTVYNRLVGSSKDLFKNLDAQGYLDFALKNIKEFTSELLQQIEILEGKINIKNVAHDLNEQMETSTFMVKNGAIKVPIDLDTTSTQFKNRVSEIIQEAQKYGSQHPVTVELTLKSKYRGNGAKELNQDDTLTEIEKVTEKEIRAELKSVAKIAKRTVDEIQTLLKETKFSVYPTVEIRPEELDEIQKKINEATKNLKLNAVEKLAESMKIMLDDNLIDEWKNQFLSALDQISLKIDDAINEKINKSFNSKKGKTKKAKDTTDVVDDAKIKEDKKQVNVLTETLVKLTKVLDGLQGSKIKLDLSDIQKMVDEFKELNQAIKSLDFKGMTMDIDKSIRNISELMNKAFGVYSSSDIEEQWNKIQQLFNNISKTKKGSVNLKDKSLTNFYSEYSKYLEMGGTNDISSIIGIDDESINKLQKKIQTLASKVVNNKKPIKLDLEPKIKDEKVVEFNKLLSSVLQEVDLITEAFHNQKSALDMIIPSEINTLEVLEGELVLIKNEIEKLSNISVKVDLPNKKSVSGALGSLEVSEKTLDSLEKLADDLLYLQEAFELVFSKDNKVLGDFKDISDYVSGFSTLKMSDKNLENFQKLSDIILNLKNNLNNIDGKGLKFLDEIKKLTAHAQELKSLATVLKSTQAQIDKAKEAVNLEPEVEIEKPNVSLEVKKDQLVEDEELDHLHEKLKDIRDIMIEINQIDEKSGGELTSKAENLMGVAAQKTFGIADEYNVAWERIAVTAESTDEELKQLANSISNRTVVPDKTDVVEFNYEVTRLKDILEEVYGAGIDFEEKYLRIFNNLRDGSYSFNTALEEIIDAQEFELGRQRIDSNFKIEPSEYYKRVALSSDEYIEIIRKTNEELLEEENNRQDAMTKLQGKAKRRGNFRIVDESMKDEKGEIISISTSFEKITESTKEATKALEEYKEEWKVLSQVGDIGDDKYSATFERNAGQIESVTWRVQRDQDGNILYDDDGEKLYNQSSVTISNYKNLEKIIVKADNELRKLEDRRNRLLEQNPEASTSGIEAQIEHQKEYINLLEQTVEHISKSKEYFLDASQIEKARNEAKEIYELEKGSKRDESAAKDYEKRTTAIIKANRYLNTQEKTIESIERKYNKALNPDLEKAVTKTEDLEALAEKKAEIQNLINELKNAPRNSSNEKEYLRLEKLIAEYKDLADYKKKANNPTKNELGGQDLQTIIAQTVAEYGKLITRAEQYGDKTEEVVEKLKNQKALLEQINDEGKYTASAEDYYKARDLLKVEKTRFSEFEVNERAAKAREKELESIRKLSAEKQKLQEKDRQNLVDNALRDQLSAWKDIQNIREKIAKTTDKEELAALNKQKEVAQQRYLEAQKTLRVNTDLYDNETRLANLEAERLSTNKRIVNEAFKKQLDEYTSIFEIKKQIARLEADLNAENKDSRLKDLNEKLNKRVEKFKEITDMVNSYKTADTKDLFGYDKQAEKMIKATDGARKEIESLAKKALNTKIVDVEDDIEGLTEIENAYKKLTKIQERLSELKAKKGDENTLNILTSSEAKELDKLIEDEKYYNTIIEQRIGLRKEEQGLDANEKDDIVLTEKEIDAKKNYNQELEKTNVLLDKIKIDQDKAREVLNSSPEIKNVNAQLAAIKAGKSDIAELKPVIESVENEIRDLNIKFAETGDIERYQKEVNKLINPLKNVFAVIKTGNIEDAENAIREYLTELDRLNGKGVEIKSTFNTANNTWKITGQWVDKATDSVKTLGHTWDVTTGQITTGTQKSKKYVSELGKITQWLGEKWKNVAGYFISFGSVYEVINILKQGVNVVREFDTALTEMRKVSDETVASLKDFQKVSFDIAEGVGGTALQIQNSTSDFLRLGYSLQEASKLAEDANIYANVGDMEIDEATEHMISSIKAWGSEFSNEVEASKAIIDRYNEIGNNFAISSADIGAAMERSAASLKAGGNTLNESLGLLVAGNLIQQDAETTAAAMKILSLRIRGAKADLEEMGEETDGLVSSTSKLRDEIKALSGVDIMLDENTFKSTTQIIQELGAVYNKLSDVSQAALLEKLAGKNRASTVEGLLQNYELIEEVMKSAENAQGSAREELEKYKESIDGHINELTNALQELATTIIDSGLVTAIIDMATVITKALNELIKFTTPLGSLFSILVGIAGIKDFGLFTIIANESTKATKSVGLFGLALDKVKQIMSTINQSGFQNLFKKSSNESSESLMDDSTIDGYNDVIDEAIDKNAELAEKQTVVQSAIEDTNKETADLIETTNKASASTEVLTETQKANTIATKAGAIAMKAFSIAGNMLIAALITKVLSAAIKKFDEYIHRNEIAIEKADELKKSLSDTISTIKEKESKLESLTERFKELSKGVDDSGNSISLTNDEFAEYKGIVEELISLNPLLIEGYNAEGEAIIDKNTALEKTIELLKEEKRIELEKATDSENLKTIAEGAIAKYNEKLGSDRAGQLKEYDLNTVSGRAAQFGTEAAKIFNEESIKAFYEYTNSRPMEEMYGTSSWLKAFGINPDHIDLDLDSYLQNNIGVFAEHMDEILEKANIDTSTEEGKEKVRELKEYVSEWVTANEELENIKAVEIDEYIQKIPLLAEEYEGLTDAHKAFLSSYMRETFSAHDLANDSIKVKTSIKELVKDISKNTELQDAINNLFSIDTSDQSVEDIKDKTEEYLKIIAEALGEDQDYLKVKLGIDENEAEMDALVTKVQGFLEDEFDGKVGELTLTELEIAATLDPTETRKNIESELTALQQGGSVNLLVRPEVDSSELEKAGWDIGEGVATVFSSTISNTDFEDLDLIPDSTLDNIAMNFTPIIADPKTGEYIGVLTEDELYQYAHDVMAGIREDDFNLQIGATFTGVDAIEEAEKAALRISELHQRYYIDDGVLLSWDQLLERMREAKALQSGETLFFSSESNVQEMDKFVSKISSLEKALDTIDSGEMDNTALYELTKEFPELEGETGDLTKAIHKLADKALEDLYEKLGSDLPDEWRERFRQMTEEVKNASDAFSSFSPLEQVEQLSEGLDILDKIYLDVLNKEDFDWSSILNNEGFKAAFKDCGSAYEEFINTIANSPNDINACQTAFNNLTTAYIYNSEKLKGVTEETKNAVIAFLEQHGVTNATAIVTEYLAAKEIYLKLNMEATTDVIYDQANGLLTQANASNATRAALVDLIAQQRIFNNTELNTADKIKELEKLALAVGITTDGMLTGAQIQARIDAAKASGNYTEEQIAAFEADIERQYSAAFTKKIQEHFSKVVYGGGSSVRNYKSSSSGTKDTPKEIDWISRKLEILGRKLNVLKTKASEVYSTFKNQNKYLDKAITNVQNQLKVYDEAYEDYMNKAKSVGLSSSLIQKVQNGAMDITKYSGKTAEKIEEYQKWYDAAQDVKDTIRELKLEERELINQRIDNIIDDYDRKKSYQNSLISLREAQAGDNPTKADYTYMIKKHNHNKVDLLREKALLEKELAKLPKGSDDWRELKQQIKDIDIEVVEIENSIADLNKAYMEDLWDQFDKGMDKLAQFQDDLSNIQSFFDGDKFDGTELTDDGLVHLTTSFQGMASAQQKIENYAHAMKDLKKQLKNGAISQEFYNEKIEEFTQAQKEASLELKQYRDAIIEIAIEGIEAETEAVNELIDAKKEELQAEKDLYSYKQSIQDKQEDITTLKKRIAALSRSTNRKDIALRLDLEEELAEKEKELAEEQANHEHDIKLEALDKEKEEFNKAQDEKIKALRNDYAAQQRVIDEYLQKVQQNYDTTMGQIKSACEEFSYDVTDYFKNPFDELMKQAKSAVDYLNSIDFDKTLNVKDNGLNTGATDDYTKENYGSTLPEAEKAASKVPEEKNPSKNTNDDGKKEKDKGKKIPDNAKVSKTSGYIKYGQKGENVKVLQRALKDLKYNIGSTGVDGKFGKNTLAAVKKFQKDNKLNQDGIVGPLTRAKFKAKGYKYGVHDLDESALSIINEVGQEMILRPSEGIIFPMQKHDTVLTAEQTDNLLALSKSDIRSDLLSRLNLEQGLTDAWTELGRTGSMSNVGCNCSCNSIGDINVSMNITGVTRDEINRETQKMIENIPNTMMTELRKHGVGVNGSRRR